MVVQGDADVVRPRELLTEWDGSAPHRHPRLTGRVALSGRRWVTVR